MQRTKSKSSLFSVYSDAPCSEIFFKGDRCQLDENRVGTVAFVGRTSFAPGDWIGLVLDKPVGKNNGSVNGVRYFECGEKFGVFCQPFKLKKLNNSNSLSPTLSKKHASPALSIPNSVASTSIATRKLRSIYAVDCGYDIGDRVKIFNGKNGVVKFLGRINDELYAGIQLDRPLGSSDGTFNNVRYFKCNPLYGIFVVANRVEKCLGMIKPTQIQVRHTKTSTMRTNLKGSHESINSVGLESNCSAAFFSPKFAKTTTGKVLVKDNDIVTSLKKCLQEKEAHLEHLSKELDQQRTEMARIVNNNFDSTNNFNKIKFDLEEEQKNRRKIELERDDLRNNIDDLMFRLDEKELINANLEADLVEYKMTYVELQEKLNLSKNENQALIKSLEVKKHKNEVQNYSKNNYQPKSDLTLNNFLKVDFSTQTEKEILNNFFDKLNVLDFKNIAVQAVIDVKNVCIQTENKTCINAATQIRNETFDKECNRIYQTSSFKHNKFSIGTQYENINLMISNSATQTENFFTTKIDKITETNTSQKHVFTQSEIIMLSETASQIVPNLNNFSTQTLENFNPIQFNLQNIKTQPSKGSTQCKFLKNSNNNTALLNNFTKQSILKVLCKYDLFVDNIKTKNLENYNNCIQEIYNNNREYGILDNQNIWHKAKTEISKNEDISTTIDVNENSLKKKLEEPVQNFVKNNQILNVKKIDKNLLKKFQNSQSQTLEVFYKDNNSQTDKTAFKTTPEEKDLLISNNFTETNDEKKHLKNGSGVQELSILSLLKNNALINPQTESQFKEQTEKTKADSTISFLNSIIYEQNCTITKLQTELMERQHDIDKKNTNNNNLNNENKNVKTNLKTFRVYCDYCEVFDLHETKKCLKDVEHLVELKKHSKTVSPKEKLINQLISSRPYCDICEAFVHETNDCPNKTLSPRW